jgi:hypothetical protein
MSQPLKGLRVTGGIKMSDSTRLRWLAISNKTVSRIGILGK